MRNFLRRLLIGCTGDEAGNFHVVSSQTSAFPRLSGKQYSRDSKFLTMKPLTVAILATLPFLFSACCSNAHPRFWKVRDTKDGATAYTVDTLAVPAGSLMPADIRYVNAAGKYVHVQSPKMVSGMSEQEWKVATSGAGYTLRYCGHREACWAKAHDR